MESRTMESTEPASYYIKAKLDIQVTKLVGDDTRDTIATDHAYTNAKEANEVIPAEDNDEICQKLAAISAIYVVSAMRTNWESSTVQLAWELYSHLKVKQIPLNKEYKDYCKFWKKVQNINADKLKKVLNKTAFADRGAIITLSCNGNSYSILFQLVTFFYSDGVKTNMDLDVGITEYSLAGTPFTTFEEMIDQVYEVRRQYNDIVIPFLKDPKKLVQIYNKIFESPNVVTSYEISRILNRTREVEMEVNFELTFPGDVPIELRDRKIIVQRAAVSAVIHSEPARNSVWKNDAELAWNLFLLMADKPYEPSMPHTCRPLIIPLDENIAVSQNMEKKRNYFAKLNFKINDDSYSIKYSIGIRFYYMIITEGGVSAEGRTTPIEEQPQMIQASDAFTTRLDEIRREILTRENPKFDKEIMARVLQEQWPDTIDV